METGKLDKKIAVIGGGHIGLAFVEGLINSGGFEPQQIIVASPSLLKIAQLKKRGVKVTTDNKWAAEQAHWVVIAVKPMIVRTVLKEIKNATKKKIIISLAAAVPIKMIQKEIHESDATVVRIMPNLPISCNQGVTGLFSNRISDIDKAQLVIRLNMLGLVVEVERESDLDTLTLVSACGPAVVSFFMETMIHIATDLGFSAKMADKLIQQTFSGTLAYLQKSALQPGELMETVATKGGVTEAMLKSMRGHGFYLKLANSVNLGSLRLKKLTEDLQN